MKELDKQRKRFQLMVEGRAKKTPQFDFEDGVKEIVSRVKDLSAKETVLIAVYGWLNRGKSHLITRLAEEFGELGIDVGGCGGAPYASNFDSIERADRYLDRFISPEGTRLKKWIVIFHCGWNREEGQDYETLFGYEDPNVLAEKMLNRKIHLNVFIYRSDISEMGIEGKYDLIIRNPDSVDKPPLGS